MNSWNVTYHYLIDAMPKGVHIINRQGILVDANRAWLIYFGANLSDIKGRYIQDVMQDMVFVNTAAIDPSAPDTEYTSPAALEVLKTGLPYSTTFHNGRMLAVARPIYSHRGDFEYVMTTITENNHAASLRQTDTASPVITKSADTATLPIIIGESDPISNIHHMIAQVSPTMANVLLCGETGTGKEVFANEIHLLSGRDPRTFIRVNCAAIPENLIESELFGYERGAFTGALTSGKAGLIEAAEGGTLFLDEINALPLAQQGKLLRVLESKAVQRVGSVREKPVNFRLLAATNVDLEQMVSEGTFRSDLYYRLNVINLYIPPLRDRREDVLPIMQYYLDFFGQQYQKNIHLSAAATKSLLKYEWPGNVRELRNLAEYLVITAPQSEILPEHLTFRNHNQRGMNFSSSLREKVSSATSPSVAEKVNWEFTEDFSLKEYLDQVERAILADAFRQYATCRQVAEVLKIDQSSAVRKKGKYGL